MAQDSAPARRTEDTRSATPAGTGEDEIPDEIRSLPDGSSAKKWALAGYERAREARARLESLTDELRARDELVTKIATAPRGEIPAERTPKVGEPDPQFKGDAFDPNFRENLESYVAAVVRRANQGMADWYIDDRAKVWDAIVAHQTRLSGMNGEFSILFRDHPQMRVEDMQRLFEEAPKHNFSVTQAYRELYRDDIERENESRMRKRIEEEVRANGDGRAPELAAPPVLGGGGPYPRRAPGGLPRPRSWGEATREANKSAAGKLFSR